MIKKQNFRSGRQLQRSIAFAILQNKQKEKHNFIAPREESRVNGSMPIELASVRSCFAKRERKIHFRTNVCHRNRDALGAVEELALRYTRERAIAFRS